MPSTNQFGGQAQVSVAVYRRPGNPSQTDGAVFIYMRASGAQPRREFARQLRNCRRVAARSSGGSFDRRTFVDFGRAHAKAVRPGLDALMERARAGEAAMVAVECPERLSRDPGQLERIVTELELAGVKVVTSTQGPISRRDITLRGIMTERNRPRPRRKSSRNERG